MRAKTVDELMTVTDFRHFRKLLHSFSLNNAATIFMQDTGEEREETQLITIHRCAYCHANNAFKPISSDFVSKMYKIAHQAVKEKEKFLSFIDEEEWRLEMMTVCENMLETTIFDKELEENVVNDNDVLKYLSEAFKRNFSGKYDIISKHKCSKLIDLADVFSLSDRSCPTSEIQNNGNSMSNDKREIEEGSS